MNIAEFVAQFLIKKKIKHVFGYQGGAVLKLIDEIAKTGQIAYVQNYHEQASAFCADAYSRVSQHLGVAIATSGPGATNLITGIANAFLDSIPVLFITGQEYSSRISNDKRVRSNGFQDLDIVSIVKPITKYAITVYDPLKLPYELEKAYSIACSGRPGPVLIDIPIDVQLKEIEQVTTDTLIEEINQRTQMDQQQLAVPVAESTEQQLSMFIEFLLNAKRPVILAGGGISVASAREEFKRFVQSTKIPVALTLNGLDVYEDNIGFSGLYGNTDTCLAVYNADLLIVLGSRLGQHQVGKSKEFFTKAKVIHIDIDPSELERAIPVDLCICSDLKFFLANINKLLQIKNLPSYEPWHNQILIWKERYPINLPLNNKKIIPLQFIQELNACYIGNTVITVDVGQNQMWLAQGIQLKRGDRLLSSSGLGSMGYSLPAAIGAKLAYPTANVIAFMGDGGFQMNMQELQLISLRQLDIKLIIINNNTLGLIRISQEKYLEKRYVGCEPLDYGCVNLKGIAAAYGIKYYNLLDIPNESLKEIINGKGPALLELQVPVDTPTRTRNDMISIFKEELIES